LTLDLDATVAYLKTLKAVRRDRIGVIGFCWGGGQSFRYATNNPALRAFVVCYGPGPDAAAIARIRARGLGVYAENDARIDAGLADVAAAVKQYAKDYRYTVYPGVGHGFLRSRERPEVADSAWGNVVRFFKESLERRSDAVTACRSVEPRRYPLSPLAAYRRSRISPVTPAKSGKARSKRRTTSSSASAFTRTRTTPPGRESISSSGRSSGQRSLSETLRVTLMPRCSPPGKRSSR